VERPHQQGIAQPTAELARLAASRRKLDPAEAAIAPRAVDIVSSHTGFYVRGGKRFQKKRFGGLTASNGTLFSPEKPRGRPACDPARSFDGDQDLLERTLSRCLSATPRARQMRFSIKGRGKAGDQ
jgi:hypothetical protein